MARIRTIRPEFPSSESMGAVSRDARLLFILMWTMADDFGKIRGDSRVLANFLFPYDDDAKKKISKWVSELEDQNCITTYTIENRHFIHVTNWSDYQRIDHPTASKLPDPPKNSLALAKSSREDAKHSLGIGREGNGVEGDRKGFSDGPQESARPVLTNGHHQKFEKPKAAHDSAIDFTELQKIYPARAGAQRWPKAIEAANARIREGYSWDQILAGARRYAAYVRATGKLKTAYVLQAATFLGTERNFLEPWDVPSSPGEVRLESNVDAAREFLHNTEPQH